MTLNLPEKMPSTLLTTLQYNHRKIQPYWTWISLV